MIPCFVLLLCLLVAAASAPAAPRSPAPESESIARRDALASAFPPFPANRASAFSGTSEHSQVRAELRFFQESGRGSMDRWLDRAGLFLPMIREGIAEANLPEELCWLPMIESGFSNDATSPKGAAGMWQLMPATARQYGLRVDAFVDERRSPRKATRAALRHLSDLLELFDSPCLAAAAYNAGSARVRRGLAQLPGGPPGAAAVSGRNGGAWSSGADRDFFRLSDRLLLAAETRQYVPRLIAASIIGRNPGRYGFRMKRRSMPPVDSVEVTKATTLESIARVAGVAPSEVRELNPEFIRGVTPPGMRAVVLLPRCLGSDPRREIAALPAACIGAVPDMSPAPARNHRSPSVRRWTRAPSRRISARAGETLNDISRRCGVPAARLARANFLAADRPLPPGQVVLVP